MGNAARTVRGSLAAAVLVAVTLAVTAISGGGGDGAVPEPAPATEFAPTPAMPTPVTSAPVAPTTVAPTPLPTSAPVVVPGSPPRSSMARPRPPRTDPPPAFSCDLAPDGVPVCEGDVPASVGDHRTPREEIERQRTAESDDALRACVEQTGMTRDECIADAAAGNAS
jgi:hypothetical protein